MLKERLNAKQMCERRDEIEALITGAIEKLAEADILLCNMAKYGFDLRNVVRVENNSAKMGTIDRLTKQLDRRMWDQVINLGQFRDLMTASQRGALSAQLDNVPKFSYETVKSTFSVLLAESPKMLQSLVEESFICRDKGFKSNGGNKINKRQVIDFVFCPQGYIHYNCCSERAGDVIKSIALILGNPIPHALNEMVNVSVMDFFDGKVTLKRFKKGTLHVIINDKDLLDKLNNVLAGRFENQIGM